MTFKNQMLEMIKQKQEEENRLRIELELERKAKEEQMVKSEESKRSATPTKSPSILL